MVNNSLSDFSAAFEAPTKSDIAQIVRHFDKEQWRPAGKLDGSEQACMYPIDNEGYGKTFDPIRETTQMRQTFANYGFVIAKDVVAPLLCEELISESKNILKALAPDYEIDKLSKQNLVPQDENGTPIFSRGFLELYHGRAWARIRQSPRLVALWVGLWGTARIWITFDRLGVKPPGNSEGKALPLHVDQNPFLDPGFTTIQGVLALRDCPVERGTTVLAPSSKQFFPRWKNYAENIPGKHFVSLENANTDGLNPQAIALRQGSIVVWDSRTVHCNSENISQATRWVALVAAGIARNNPDIVRERLNYYLSRRAVNIREAYLHASKKPRYSDSLVLSGITPTEDFSLWGKLLYGLKSYDDLMVE